MKTQNITLEYIAFAIALLAIIFTLSAGLHIYHLTEAGIINWKS